MRTGSEGESRTASGFWARLASAFADGEWAAKNRVEERLARLENQVAQLIEASERPVAKAASGNVRR